MNKSTNIGERMMAVETKLDIIEVKLDKFIETADNRYAGKYIEDKVNENCKIVDNIKAKINYYTGAIAVVFTIINIAIAIYF